jgi:hypothetical protein
MVSVLGMGRPREAAAVIYGTGDANERIRKVMGSKYSYICSQLRRFSRMVWFFASIIDGGEKAR